MLKARHTVAYDGGPLVVVEASRHLAVGVELRPQQLRALAQLLVSVADDAERRPLMRRGKRMPDDVRSYGPGGG